MPIKILGEKKTLAILFIVLAIEFTTHMVSAGLILTGTIIECNGDWGQTDMICSYSTPESRCDNLMYATGVLPARYNLLKLYKLDDVTLNTDGESYGRSIYIDGYFATPEDQRKGYIDFPTPLGCYVNHINSCGQYLCCNPTTAKNDYCMNFNAYSYSQGTFTLKLNRTEAPPITPPVEPPTEEPAEPADPGTLPSPAPEPTEPEITNPGNATLKNSALNAINTTEKNLISAAIEVDAKTKPGLLFTVAGCAFNFVPSPIKGTDKAARVAWDIWKKTVQTQSEDISGKIMKLMIIESYENTVKNTTDPYFREAYQKIESANDSNIVKLKDTEFAKDINKMQRFAILNSSSWPNIIKNLNNAYDNAQLAKTAVVFGASILCIAGGPIGGVALLALNLGMGASQCVIDFYSLDIHIALISRILADAGGQSITYADRIEKGITYLGTIQNETDLPKIKITNNLNHPSRSISIMNTGLKNANIEAIHEINYQVNTDILKLYPQSQYLQGNESFVLAPGETKTLLLTPEPYINDWINQIPYSCTQQQNQYNAGAMLQRDYTIHIFYGEKDLIALKEISGETLDQPIPCKSTTSTVLPITIQGSGGGGSSNIIKKPTTPAVTTPTTTTTANFLVPYLLGPVTETTAPAPLVTGSTMKQTPAKTQPAGIVSTVTSVAKATYSILTAPAKISISLVTSAAKAIGSLFGWK